MRGEEIYETLANKRQSAESNPLIFFCSRKALYFVPIQTHREGERVTATEKWSICKEKLAMTTDYKLQQKEEIAPPNFYDYQPEFLPDKPIGHGAFGIVW